MSSFQPQNLQNTIPYIPPQNTFIPPVSTNNTAAVQTECNAGNVQTTNGAAPVTGTTTSAPAGNGSSGYYGCYPPQYYCTTPTTTTPGPAVEININNPTTTSGPVYLPHTQCAPMYCTPVQTQPVQAQPVQQQMQPVNQAPTAPAPTTPLEPPKTEQPKAEEKKTPAPLTDEYIRSLENYLNNPNADVRLTGAKQLLNTFKEDKSRKDDQALTNLLNKALRDPSQKVRLMALACLDGDYAEGDELTLQILDSMQNSGDVYNQDAVTASEIRLKKAGRNINPNTTQPPKKSSNDPKSDVGKKLDVTAG